MLEAHNNERSKRIRDRLIEYESSWYKVTGGWLDPVAQPGQWVLLEPVRFKWHFLKVGDIVFCQVQPGDWLYVHWIVQIQHDVHTLWDGDHPRRFVIGNNDDPPDVDGTCYDWHIFGRVIEVA